MALPVVIIHGWSDSAASFKPLADAIRAQTMRPVSTISLADWMSMDDRVNYDDVVLQMDRAWDDAGLPRAPRSVDVIVHSTGGLVIRDWLVRFFGKGQAPPAAGIPIPATPSPIHHLVMLAPANFGSPLAHKGTSFIGRVIKGWNPGQLFEVGALILKGLELGSTYTWNLARKDRFGSLNLYDVGGTLTTVLVGNKGWSGISAAANEPGTDGTVRVSTANMNCAYLFADFTNVIAGEPPPPADYRLIQSVGRAAFSVLDGLNHSQVHDPTQPAAFDAIMAALETDDAHFPDYCDDLDAQTIAVLAGREAASDSYYWGYQNAVFFVRDNQGVHISDYFIEFYNDHASNFLEEFFHRKVLQDVHAFSVDSAYRAMLLDITTLRKGFAQSPVKVLKISLTAQPDFQSHNVGYSTFNDNDIGAITLDQQEVEAVFVPNRTVLIEVQLQRKQHDNVFTFEALS